MRGTHTTLGQMKLTGDNSLELLGAATVFDDVTCPAVSAGTASSNPTFQKWLDNGAGSAGIFGWNFVNPGNENDLMFTVQWPHGILPGSVAVPSLVHAHIHWSPNDANAGNVGWGLEYSEAQPGAAFPANTTLAAPVANSTTSTARAHLMTEWADLSSTTRSLSGILYARVYRTDSGGIDTYNGTVYLHAFDVHVEKNRIGSRSELLA